ncbi:MAG: hypothetical protein WCW02_02860 [Candidatus Buchananbacteria bacterium]
MGVENKDAGSPDSQPKKQFKVGIEMEVRGKDGTEIEGGNLWEDVIVDASSEDEARDIVFNKMDFGNRKPNGYSEVEEIIKPTSSRPTSGKSEEPPLFFTRLGK